MLKSLLRPFFLLRIYFYLKSGGCENRDLAITKLYQLLGFLAVIVPFYLFSLLRISTKLLGLHFYEVQRTPLLFMAIIAIEGLLFFSVRLWRGLPAFYDELVIEAKDTPSELYTKKYKHYEMVVVMAFVIPSAVLVLLPILF